MVMGYSIEKEFLLVLGPPIYLIIDGIRLLLKKKKCKRVDTVRELVKFGFALYIMALIGVTLFPIRIDFGGQSISDNSIVINLIPFIKIANDVTEIGNGRFSVGFQIQLLLRNGGGKFILLMPIGFLVPILWKKVKSLKNIMIVGFAVSLSIELLQLLEGYLKVGFARVVDVDDLILNVLGAVFGHTLYKLVNLLISKYKSQLTKVC